MKENNFENPSEQELTELYSDIIDEPVQIVAK